MRLQEILLFLARVIGCLLFLIFLFSSVYLVVWEKEIKEFLEDERREFEERKKQELEKKEEESG